VVFIVCPEDGVAADSLQILLKGKHKALVGCEAFSQRNLEFSNIFTLDFDLREDAISSGVLYCVADGIELLEAWQL
jgi:hypothetical protein